MKRRTLFIALILVMVMQVPALALSERTSVHNPGLSFSGTTAYCSISVTGDPDDEVSVVLTLWNGREIIASWSAASTSRPYVAIVEEATVIKGQSYKLVADIYINGELVASPSKSGTCP